MTWQRYEARPGVELPDEWREVEAQAGVGEDWTHIRRHPDTVKWTFPSFIVDALYQPSERICDACGSRLSVEDTTCVAPKPPTPVEVLRDLVNEFDGITYRIYTANGQVSLSRHLNRAQQALEAKS